MKIAVPIESGRLSGHFGHASHFAFVRLEEGRVVDTEILVPPPHEPGSLPRWLGDLKTTHVICAGIGGRAVDLLRAAGVEVITGVQGTDPAHAVEDFLAGRLSGITQGTCKGHDQGPEGSGHQCKH